MGSMSVSFEERKQVFRPWYLMILLPSTTKTIYKKLLQNCRIILETIRWCRIHSTAEWFSKSTKTMHWGRCHDDSRWNSAGFWRTGAFWFQNYDVVPDIVVMGKEWWRHARRRICFIWYDAFIEY
jgi:hypothetical protein